LLARARLFFLLLLFRSSTDVKVSDSTHSQPNDHGMVLRSTAMSSYKPTLTKPKPFNFSDRLSTRTTVGNAAAAHSKPHIPATHVEKPSAPSGPTRPISPQLLTKQRAKEPATPSEDREVEYVKKRAGSFKAKPVNSAVMSGQVGVPPAAPPKPPTEPVPFAVSNHPDPYEQRERAAKLAEKAAAEQRKFTARPVPDYDMCAGIPNVHSKPVTQPQPFELRSEALHEKAQREMAERACQLELERHEAAQFHARPVPAAVVQQYVAPTPRPFFHRHFTLHFSSLAPSFFAQLKAPK
jgi:hypothetical protein